LIEQVAGALEEQHAEDVFLVLAGIHVAAQVIAGRQQQAFEAGECEFGGWHSSVCFCFDFAGDSVCRACNGFVASGLRG
jgi:hypothetical protein